MPGKTSVAWCQPGMPTGRLGVVARRVARDAARPRAVVVAARACFPAKVIAGRVQFAIPMQPDQACMAPVRLQEHARPTAAVEKPSCVVPVAWGSISGAHTTLTLALKRWR